VALIRAGVLTEKDFEEDDQTPANPSYTFMDVTSFTVGGRRAY